MERWRELYPFASHYLDLGEARMHYVDQGQGLPLVMVHGNPTWSFYYRHLISGLQDRYRAIAVDHVGCGLSDKPPHYRYTLAQRIEDLVFFLETLDLTRVTMIVHDWGGAIGLGAAEKVPGRIARLIILNTGAFPPPYIPWRIRVCRTPLLGTVAIRGLNVFARAALRMATLQPRGLSPAVRAGLLAPYANWRNRIAIDHFVRDIPSSPTHPTWQVLKIIERGLPFLATRPTQILWGMGDWCFTPVCLERFQTLFPRAEIHEFPQAGHYLLEDAPQEVLEHIRSFLSRTDQDLAATQANDELAQQRQGELG